MQCTELKLIEVEISTHTPYLCPFGYLLKIEPLFLCIFKNKDIKLKFTSRIADVMRLQSSSAGRQTHSKKTKAKKNKSPKRSACSDGEGSPLHTRTKKSKKKKVASAERTPSSDCGSKSKDVIVEEKMNESQVLESASNLSADASKPSLRVTLRNSGLSAASPKIQVGPRTPPGPEPASVSFMSLVFFFIFFKS